MKAAAINVFRFDLATTSALRLRPQRVIRFIGVWNRDFSGDISINSGKKGSKKKRRERFQTLFSFSVDPTKLDNSDKKELEEFVSSYQRKKSKVRIRVSPLYNKMTTKDED